MARVFSLKHSLTSVGNVGITSVDIESVYQNDSLAKQNVLRVSHGKVLPASYLRNTSVSICLDSSHSSHVQGTCIISRDV